ncbi:type II toxin-antitoxin system prevent-host-death family antitoxin [Boseongicola sp. H5]|uniref:type II toxin-antitoxin system Phd/YefM family antitoxin n=1 Tax=Boseongicola sp. H5 TaxID=2763261 RepID=UPI001D09ED29|nr:type II toxin-antitoxin system prevent-host-death family antitoxin [Boseongicola sp. H5]
MQRATVTELRRSAETLLERAAREPILITRYGKPAFVLMSADHFRALTREFEIAGES